MEDVDNHLPGLHSPLAYTPSGAHHAIDAQDTFLLALNVDEEERGPTCSRLSKKRITKAEARVSLENSTQHSHPVC